MRRTPLSLFAAFALCACAALAQPISDLVFVADPQVPGRYTAGATFSHAAGSGFVDAVSFAAPVNGFLSIELLALPQFSAGTTFFQAYELDGSFTAIHDSSPHLVLGPVTVFEGTHLLTFIGASATPHGSDINDTEAYNLGLTLVAVPEAQTGWLMLVGLAALGGLAKRGPTRRP